MKLDTNKRYAGLFVPVFAIRTGSDLGVGDVTGLKQMLKWSAANQFQVLQILPINETSDDNSPYNAISSQSIDITTLSFRENDIPGYEEHDLEKLVSYEELKSLNVGPVQYRKVKQLKLEICRLAFERNLKNPDWEQSDAQYAFQVFQEEESEWLAPYVVFRALMARYDGTPVWEQWAQEHQSPEAIKNWLQSANEADAMAFEKECEFYAFVQWLLFRQWESVRVLADEIGVALMGDIPFGVSRSSADVWAEPDLFNLAWGGGAPPEPLFASDAFTVKWGQNWGVPVYNWDEHKKDNYVWWRRRIHAVTRFFHVFRLDHVLGFYRIFAFPWQPHENWKYVDMEPEQVKEQLGNLPHFIPASDDTEEGMKMNQKQGEQLLRMVIDAAGSAAIIAEDLGMVPDYVRPSLQSLGISVFKIPVFTRQEWDKEYIHPEKYPLLSLSTLSTHDHQTMGQMWKEWWRLFDRSQAEDSVTDDEKQNGIYASWELYRTLRFAKMDDRELMRDFMPSVHLNVIRRLMESQSWMVVLMITDLFNWDLRFNVPGPASESNWSERLPSSISELRLDVEADRVLREVHQMIEVSDRMAEVVEEVEIEII
ncbi:MAG: 4-alpha-glucanotransferase [Verrucomicrobiota bacterium]